MARRYPAVLKLLASTRVSLTTIRLLAPHLTRDNQEGLFAEVAGKRTRDVKLILARRFPQADVPSTVRKLPSPAARVESPGAAGYPSLLVTSAALRPVTATSVAASPALPAPAAPAVSIPAPPPPLMRPIAEDRFRITFTANTDTCEMLELARDLLRHAVPNGDAAEIFARSLAVLVDDLVRKKFAVTDKPRASRGQAKDSRNIPAEVQRAVYIRDRGRCAYIARDGHRCGERAFIEFHHVCPYGVGGPPTVDNVELRCQVHNLLEAELFYGPHVRHASVRETSPAYCRVKSHTFSLRNESAARFPMPQREPRHTPAPTVALPRNSTRSQSNGPVRRTLAGVHTVLVAGTDERVPGVVDGSG